MNILPSLSVPRIIESTPQAFGILLSQVISNDRAHKQRQEPQREEHRDPSDLVSSLLQLTSRKSTKDKELSSSNSSLSSTSETATESPSPSTPEAPPHTRRRVGFYLWGCSNKPIV